MSTSVRRLTQTNAVWLRQALDLIRRLDDVAYANVPAGLEPHKAGSHLRHILDFYECLLDGLDSAGHVDYDARKRVPFVEVSRTAAADRIGSLLVRLEALPAEERELLVRPEASDDDDLLPSSLSRELMFLSSHTIHHFALIRVTLLGHGFDVDPRFGTAPSTLRHQQRQNARGFA